MRKRPRLRRRPAFVKMKKRPAKRRRAKRPLSIPSCRLCGGHRPLPGTGGGFIRFGVRHYAHMKCYLGHGKSLDALPPAERRKFPLRLLRRYGLDRGAP